MADVEWSDDVAAIALADLDKMGPTRLHAVLGSATPGEAVRRLRSGARIADVPPGLVDAWRRQLGGFDPARARAALDATDVVVTWTSHQRHPQFMVDDVGPAPVLFRRGRAIDEASPAVAIVGTRRASGVGREIARELGLGLAEAGVTVISGLALGIDGAAHEGALIADAAPPLAFVGGGVDVVYPRRHHDLWGRVARGGTIASEAPPGARPVAWRFPARNRLIAAAADIVVVVESRSAGGSLLTVDEAIRRDRQVMAVPGSLRNPAAAGVNALLADGCAPVLSVGDVLTALGITTVDRSTRRAAEPAGRVSSGCSVKARQVLDSCDEGPASIDELVGRTGLDVGAVLAAVSELIVAGHLLDDGAKVRRP